MFSIYFKPLLLFIIIILISLGAISTYQILAQEPVELTNYDYELFLAPTGELYLGRQNLISRGEPVNQRVLYRHTIKPDPGYTDEILIAVFLPYPISEAELRARFRSSAEVLYAEAYLINPTAIIYEAGGIEGGASLTIEFELPEAYLQSSFWQRAYYFAYKLPPSIWAIISLALPLITLTIFLVILTHHRRRLTVGKDKKVSALPSRLPPAIVGILFKGHLTTREIAATLLDLAKRGHLTIRPVRDGYRFTRRQTADQLADFEAELLDQIFGPAGNQTSSDEVSFSLAKEVFSTRISQAYYLAYQQLRALGFFYQNPLKIHRRYQLIGSLLLLISFAGLMMTIFIYSYLISASFIWLAMAIIAVLIIFFSKKLPARTLHGDREVERWLAFYRFLKDRDKINYGLYNQEKYLAYLGYAIIFDCEIEWTHRFSDLPFYPPDWFIIHGAANIEEFARALFPFIGHLAHTLSMSTQPATR